MSDLSRRDALKALGAIAVAPVAAPALVGLTPKGRVIAGGFVPDDSTAGHALRDGTVSLPANRPTRRVQVAIVGGGVGGLSAGWRLDALGLTDWVLLELAPRTGGNARSAHYPGLNGQRAPWGAHYLPLPSEHAVHVRQLLRELGVLSPNGTYDERMLCHTPQERIWQHGAWRDGLSPLDAATRDDRAQFARFEARIAELRASGCFSVPSALGHATRQRLERQGGARVAATVTALDGLTAQQWMAAEGFTSPALRWWVEYGTRDDYGASLSQASAWAAVHYFAGRDTEDDGPLTWPEGNDWLVQRLAQRLSQRTAADAGARVMTGAPVARVERRATANGTCWVVDSPTVRVEADAVIWAAPVASLPRVCAEVTLPVAFDHAPWVVANLVLDRMPRERGVPLAWDNVIYGSAALGYVNASHQHLGTPPGHHVWTWYHAVVDRPGREGRRWLQQRPWHAWRDEILADLRRAHPDIDDCVRRMDIMRWGHAMARPLPGVLARVQALQAWRPAPRLFAAHADLSNLSLFEEAQWHGVQAAEQVVQVLR